MAWVVGTIVVVGALVGVARRRMRRGPSYDAATQGRIDDHAVRRSAENGFDRFGGGQI